MRDADHDLALRAASARERLLGAGAASLPRQPWLAGQQPPAAADLIQFAAWRAREPAGLSPADTLAAIALLADARAEVDQIEAALLFTARAAGLSWGRIARAMGLLSPQAAQQRFGRVCDRAADDPRSPR